MCSNCFGRHVRKGCTNTKVLWIDYVKEFMQKHKDIPEEYYGKWAKIINESSSNGGLETEQSTSATTFNNLVEPPPTSTTRGEVVTGTDPETVPVSETETEMTSVETETEMTSAVEPEKMKKTPDTRTESVDVMLERLRSLGVESTLTLNKPKNVQKKSVSTRTTPRESRRNSLK